MITSIIWLAKRWYTILLLLSFRSVAVFGVHFLLNTHFIIANILFAVFLSATKYSGVAAHQN